LRNIYKKSGTLFFSLPLRMAVLYRKSASNRCATKRTATGKCNTPICISKIFEPFCCYS